MCGICGFTHASTDEAPILRAMCHAIRHRGPDGEGRYIADGVAFGHRRLSLIDLEGGSQPMVRVSDAPDAATLTFAADGKGAAGEVLETGAGRFAIVFNGEIYNYRDIRAELEAAGWAFTTDSDTEVLLVAYIAWGSDALTRLRGMFAFAIWDRERQTVFCARDYFGIKPFYYTVVDGRLIFASEIKAILEHPAYERALNRRALDQYLCFQFSALRETFFQDVYKLEPACSLTFDVRDGSVAIERWWRPTFAPDDARSFEEAVEDIDRAVRDSVAYHNVADVEVGSFLSSGIDSSYLAARLSTVNPDIKTFTVGFSEYEGERDEISWASELAGRLGIANGSKYITEEEYWACLPQVQWHMDEPLADPSAVALYFVDQLAAQSVKAVLSGEGADELFSGYRIYQVPLSNERISWIPRPLRAAGARVLKALGLRGANYLERSIERPEDWYYTNANGAAFTVAERERILKDPQSCPTPQELTAPIYAEAADEDDITRMQYVDLFFWLVGDILLKTDKMSMAHSLESRVPFLDKEIFALAASLPTRQRISDTQTKISLRAASERILPTDWAQKEKLGFPVPLKMWLAEQGHADDIRAMFATEEAAAFFNTDELARLIDDHQAGTCDNSRKIWIIAMFLLWYRIYFIDRAEPSEN